MAKLKLSIGKKDFTEGKKQRSATRRKQALHSFQRNMP